MEKKLDFEIKSYYSSDKIVNQIGISKGLLITAYIIGPSILLVYLTFSWLKIFPQNIPLSVVIAIMQLILLYQANLKKKTQTIYLSNQGIQQGQNLIKWSNIKNIDYVVKNIGSTRDPNHYLRLFTTKNSQIDINIHHLDEDAIDAAKMISSCYVKFSEENTK